jgi:hypothetical protein
VRDTAPTPRRRRVVEVAEAPVVREDGPLPWANYRWAQPTKCEIPVDINDRSKGLCGVVYTPEGNQRCCRSEACIRNMMLLSDRRRTKIYREGHREEIRARNCNPKAYARHKELRDQRKALQPPLWKTCRWWKVVADGVLIEEDRYRCPASEGQYKAKRKNSGFCCDACEHEHKKYYYAPPKPVTCKKCGCGFLTPLGHVGRKPMYCPDCEKSWKPAEIPAGQSIEQAKPWLAEGISRMAWFKLKRNASKS